MAIVVLLIISIVIILAVAITIAIVIVSYTMVYDSDNNTSKLNNESNIPVPGLGPLVLTSPDSRRA